MKWSELTLKERKQIYDAVRAENPNASYFDIKSQFDSIPGYEDGKYTPSPHIIDFIIKREGFIPSPIIPKGDSKLTVGYGFTDPYIINKYKNQEITRLEADSILTEELSKRVVPFIESTPNFNKLNGNQRDALFSYFYNFGEGNYRNSDKMQTALKEENWKEVANQIDADYTDPINKGARKRRDAERALFLTPITSVNNFNEPYKEVNPIITWDQIVPAYEEGGKKVKPPKELGLTPGTPEYYKRQQQISGKAELVQPEAYITPAGYIKDVITTAEELEKGNYGNAAVSTLMNAIPWGVGKGLRKIKSRVSNTLNTPMLHLKRALVNEGKIHDWSSKVNQNTIEDFLFDPRNTGVVNNANKLQYNMYRNKSRFVDRINNLTPMEFITPLLLPVAGYEINKE
jgi:GH24 family phage-related lysozyme (muramidase)